jgi:hypothetical protein
MPALAPDAVKAATAHRQYSRMAVRASPPGVRGASGASFCGSSPMSIRAGAGCSTRRPPPGPSPTVAWNPVTAAPSQQAAKPQQARRRRVEEGGWASVFMAASDAEQPACHARSSCEDGRFRAPPSDPRHDSAPRAVTAVCADTALRRAAPSSAQTRGRAAKDPGPDCAPPPNRPGETLPRARA